MSKPLGKPNDRGLYSTEKAGRRFWIGKEEREAERRKAAIEALFDSIGGQWDDLSLTVAKAIARGEKELTLQPPADAVGDSDLLTVTLRVWQRKYPWVELTFDGFVARHATELAAVHLAERKAMLDAFGNGTGLHDALDAYGKATKEKHVNLDDGFPTEFAMAEERFVAFIKRVCADMPLAKFDMAAIDGLRLTIAKRPHSYKKKPIAVETVRRLVKTLNRFIKWLHKSPDFTWRKPDDYEIERIRPQETNAEIQARYNPHNNPIYSPGQIATLFKYATPQERVLILLGLNCGFKQAESLGLQVGEYDLAEKLLARRSVCRRGGIVRGLLHRGPGYQQSPDAHRRGCRRWPRSDTSRGRTKQQRWP